MFVGLTSQISGWVASKTGGGQPPAEEDPNATQQLMPDNNIEGVDDQAETPPVSGMASFAKGLMLKGLSVKENLKEKASALNAQNFQGFGSNFIGGITNLIPGRKEEEVPTPPEQIPPADMGEEMIMEDDQQYLEQE